MLPRRRAGRAEIEEPETVVQHLQDLRRRERGRLRCGKLDGERVAVEPPADFRHRRGGGIRQPVSRPLGGARREQFDRGKLARLVRRGPLAGVAFQPAQAVHALAADPEGLAARREDAHVIEVAGEPIHGSGHGRQKVLAIVEQQDVVLLLQRVHDARQRVPARHTEAERVGDRRRHELRIADRRKVDERGTVGALLGHRMGCRDRDCRLADAAGADNRYDPRLLQIAQNGLDRTRPAKDARCSRWQTLAARRRCGRGACLAGRLGCLNRCDKSVATACHRRDVPGRAWIIAEGPSQGGDIDLEVALVDDNVWPTTCQQLAFVHELAWSLDQCRQNIQRAVSDPDRHLAFEEQLSLGNQHERSEGKGPRSSLREVARHKPLLPTNAPSR